MSDRTPRIGTLRDRVQLQTKAMTAEADGGHQAVYVPLATVWARVHTRPAGLRAQGDARTARATHSVVMRHRNDLTAGDRVLYRGRALEILSSDDLNGARAFTSCACIETSVAG